MKKGILIKRKEDGKQLSIEMVEINAEDTRSNLQQIYDLLEVDLIDVVVHQGMSIYVDDEGLLKSDPKPTLYLDDYQQTLYGNVLILGNVDDEGETQGITPEDISKFKKSKLMVHRFTGIEMLVW